MAGSVAPRLSLLPMLLVLAAADPPPAGEVWQSPLYAVTPEGGSLSIACSVHTNGTLLGVHLRQGHVPKTLGVTFYDGESAPTVDQRFLGRVLFSGPPDRLTVTVQGLQPEDTGAYFCEAVMEEGKAWGAGTTVVVTDSLHTVPSRQRLPRDSAGPLHLPHGPGPGLPPGPAGPGCHVCAEEEADQEPVLGAGQEHDVCDLRRHVLQPPEHRLRPPPRPVSRPPAPGASSRKPSVPASHPQGCPACPVGCPWPLGAARDQAALLLTRTSWGLGSGHAWRVDCVLSHLA
ncbi:T-cell antigen CD7 isoform X2 [Pipistrellus kuhlii]|uniref:T-cell antigen CD7 isoform X2 n=1 Tax=Pipistrellus kuhlii TaxID=59472 RepID=UPI00174F0B8D|nr:T-cell antigen CD7 isoform X2 [Pipistrellus kuhlii]